MIDSYYRTPYQRFLLEPLIKRGLFNKLSPKAITLFAMGSGLLVPLFLMGHAPLLAFLCLLFSGFCDTFDGSLARHKNQATPEGAILDITSDRTVEFAVILGLYLYAPGVRAGQCLWMLGSIFLCVTTFLVVGIFEENTSEKSFHYSPGIIERGEAFIFFSLMILFPSLFGFIAPLFTILTLLTASLRIKNFKANH